MTLGLSLFDLVTVMVVVWGMFHVKHYAILHLLPPKVISRAISTHIPLQEAGLS